MARYARSDLPNPLVFAGIVTVVLAAVLGGDPGARIGGDAPALTRLISDGTPLAPDAPRQTRLSQRDRFALPLADGLQATATHRFDFTALVLSRKRYTRGSGAQVAPIDLALGWGPMSAPETALQLRIDQSDRFAWVSARDPSALTPEEIDGLLNHFSNMHIVPASNAVRENLMAVQAGSLVRVEGHLVQMRGPRGFRWNSSTSRTDRGAGACELVLVHKIETIENDQNT